MGVKRPTEAGFQRLVEEYAVLKRWWVHHQPDSRRSTAGLPDLILLRPPRLVLAELKTASGKVRPEQAAVMAMLRAVPGVECYLWRPSDWGRIEEVLR